MLCVVGAAIASHQSVIVARPALALTVIAGIADMTANVFATLSTQAGQVAIAGVLVSLYPATTVALSRVVDREPIARPQLVAFAVAAGALVLMAV